MGWSACHFTSYFGDLAPRAFVKKKKKTEATAATEKRRSGEGLLLRQSRSTSVFFFFIYRGNSLFLFVFKGTHLPHCFNREIYHRCTSFASGQREREERKKNTSCSASTSSWVLLKAKKEGEKVPTVFFSPLQFSFLLFFFCLTFACLIIFFFSLFLLQLDAMSWVHLVAEYLFFFF